MLDLAQSVSSVLTSLEYGDIKKHHSGDACSLTLGEGHTWASGPLHFTTRAFPRPGEPDDHGPALWLWCFPLVKADGKRSRYLSVGRGECHQHPDTVMAYSVRLIPSGSVP